MNTYASARCTANITVKRGRIKSYNDSVYLKNGQNFEIELFNPHGVPVLAKISINGHFISESGIIIRPGRREYLERFIDVDKKFTFDVYEIEDSKAAANATKNNGKVEVFFYKENILNLQLLSTNYRTIYGSPNSGGVLGSPDVYTIPWTSSAPGNIGVTGTMVGPGCIGVSSISTSTSFVSDTTSALYSYTSSNNANLADCQLLSENVKETGRIAQGDKSSQSFSYSDGNFNSFYDERLEIKILPISAKPVEIKELNKHCTNCGAKIKKQTWKFCPVCGDKIE